MMAKTAEIISMRSEVASEDERDPAARELFAQLIAQAQAGDRAAFEQIMVCAQHRVVRIAWRMLGDAEDARDAAQETFLRAYKYLHRFDPDQDFNAWLYRITINVCRRMRRKAKPSQLHEEEFEGREMSAAIYSAHDTEAAIAFEQQRRIVARALETLSRRERVAIVLRDMEGLSTEETARILGTRPATVRSQVAAARSKIKLYCDRFMREKGAR